MIKTVLKVKFDTYEKLNVTPSLSQQPMRKKQHKE